MELAGSLVLERYRFAVERQNHFAGVAREAFASYARFTTIIGLGGVGLIAGRDSLALDQAMMPDLLDVLASLVSFVAIVAVVQIAVAVWQRRRYRRLELEIEPVPTTARSAGWLVEAVYVAVIVIATLAAWRVSGGLGHDILRTASSVSATRPT